jgi:WD40 repeat protein
MAGNGGDLRRLTNNPAQDFNSVWQPRSSASGGSTMPSNDTALTGRATLSAEPVDQIVQLQAPSEHSDRIMNLAFSPDGRLLASGGYDQLIYLGGVPR